MSVVLRAVESLCETANKHGVEARFAPASPETLVRIQQFVPLSPELLEWYGLAAPEKVRIEWSAGDLGLYSLPEQFMKHQTPFRWSRGSEPKVTVEEGWDPSWVIIGDESGNPFFVHADRPGSPVSFCWHDEDWIPIPLAPSLECFLHVLRVWIEVYYGEFEKHFTDEACRVLPEFRIALRRSLRDILPEAFVHSLLSRMGEKES